MFAVEFSVRAQKSLRKCGRSGLFPQTKFRQTLLCLKEGKPLSPSFQDHALKGSLAGYREFHLAQDILVQYEIDLIEKVVTIAKIGTHTELFGG